MEFIRSRQQYTSRTIVLGALCAVALWFLSAMTAHAALQAQWVSAPGSGSSKAAKEAASVTDHCGGGGWVSTYMLDDAANSIRHIGEEDTDAGITQLCIRSTTPGISVQAGWSLYSCPAGMVDTGVRDDLDGSHTTNEEDYQPNGNNDYVWCLGASGNGASMQTRWEMWTSNVKAPPCQADEAQLLHGRNWNMNLNNEDNAGDNQMSLCAKIVEPPTVDITANSSNGPITLAANSNVSLFWSTTGGPSTCTASGAWSGDKTAGGGSENQSVGTTQKTYTITCSNAAGSDTDQVTVMIAPSLDLKVNGSDGPITVSYGSSLSLNWSSQNTSSCALYGAGLSGSGVAVNGSRSVSATISDNYVLSCNGYTDTVTVNVTVPPPVPSCSVSPTTITSGQSVTWTSSVTGGNGTYAYSWTGTDSLSGSGASVSKTYNTTGTKTGRVTVTSGGQSASADCASSVLVNAAASLSPTATPGSCGTGQINVSWNSIAGATSYEIRIDNATLGAAEFWLGVGNATSYSHTGLAAGSTHTYQVRARTASGPGTPSSQISAVAPSACSSMTKPVASFTSVPACTVGQPYTVRFKSVDVEGESVRFDYSWNWGASPAQGQNGVAPNTPNNTDASYTYTYTAAGTYTIAVRAIDSLIGDFVTTTVTCSAAAASYVTLEGRVNGGAYSTADRTINSGDQVEFRWASNLSNCTSYSGISGVSSASGGPVGVTEPSAGSSQTYSVTCNTGATSITESIVVTANAAQPTSLTANVFAVINHATADSSYVLMYPGDTIQTVAWTQTGATSCTLYGPSGALKTSNRTSDNVSVSAPPEGVAHYYYVSCYKPGESTVDDITIEMYGYVPPPPPPDPYPTATISGRIANGSWTTNDFSITNGQQIELQWTSTDATYGCVAYPANVGFSTGYQPSGTDTTITEPGAGRSQYYDVNCSNSTYSVWDEITVTNITPNTPPTAPTISGPTTGYSGTSYQFAIASSTDPNGDTIRYEVDWNNNNSSDQASSYFSPTPTSVYRPSYTWSTAGTKTFCVWAYDGIAASAKTCHTITLTAPPPPTVDLKVNNDDGPINVRRGDDITVSWDIQNYAGSCTLYGAEVNPTQWWNSGQRSVSGTGSITIDTSDSSFNSITSEDYFLQCGSYDDTATVNLTSMYLTYEIRENAGAWSMNDITVPAGSPLELHWNYTHPQATNCTSLDFATGNRIKSTNFDSNGGVSVGTLTAGQSKSFTIRCNTWSGYTTATIVATAHRPNLTTPIVNTPVLGTFSTTTNTYNTVSFTFRTENDGGSAVPAPPPTADYRFEFDNDVNCSSGCTYETVYNRTNALEALASGAGTNKTEQVSNVTAGVHRIRITVDSGNEVTENNETDNVYTGTVTIPMQDPGVSITTNRPQVRKDDTATITWTITNPNPTLSCVVSGPGLTPQTYTASGNLTTPPITAKSEYSLRCTDSSTGTIWQRSVSVETTGTVEEI